MRFKTILAGTTALALAGASLVYAQQRQQQDPGDYAEGAAQSLSRRAPDRARLSDEGFFGVSWEDRAAFLNARIAALKAGLELTPDQEKIWPAFESALRNLEQLRANRMNARREDEALPTRIGRLRRDAEALTNTGAALRQLADAEEPLLNSLNDAQKRRFFFFARLERQLDRSGFGRPTGPEEGRRPRDDRLEGSPPRRDGDRSDRDDRRGRSFSERPDWPGMDSRGSRGFDEPRGRDGRDRRGPGAYDREYDDRD